MSAAVAAVDLGATSGRVMLGRVSHNELSLHSVARFPNGPVDIDGELHWDIEGLYANVLSGLAAAARHESAIASIGVDSWAVDYALLKEGRMLGTPFHYRDERNAAGVEAVHESVSRDELYAESGLQFLPFNTLYQLAADQRAGRLERADAFLLIPDLINFWLTGEQAAERTNASTTGLLSSSTGRWNESLIAKLGFARGIFPPVLEPGSPAGSLLPALTAELGFSATVTSVASHDTASAVVAVPATRDDFAYISCGTWGLVGVELEHPVLSDESREANFTNERGVDGRVRYLHNVMGLWLLNESVRTWEEAGESVDLPALLAQAALVDAPVAVFDTNDQRFLSPGDMPARIAAWCREHGAPVPNSRVEYARSIIESLAAAFTDAVHTASRLSSKSVSVIHIVGGGSQNGLLCQLTADRSGVPVLAGPVEATAIGNVLVQARAQGMVNGNLESLRALVAASFRPIRYLPRY